MHIVFVVCSCLSIFDLLMQHELGLNIRYWYRMPARALLTCDTSLYNEGAVIHALLSSSKGKYVSKHQEVF